MKANLLRGRNPPNAVGAASRIAPKTASGLASFDARTRCNRGIAGGPFRRPGPLSGLDRSLEMSASEHPIRPRRCLPSRNKRSFRSRSGKRA
jgi:hypothetical protein